MSLQPHTAQLDLLGPRPVRFDGFTYRRELDEARLTSNLRRVLWCLLNGEWWTLAQLRCGCLGRCSEAGVSARIRDLRKPRFGGFTINHRRQETNSRSGLWLYRLATGLVTQAQLDAIFNERKA